MNDLLFNLQPPCKPQFEKPCRNVIFNAKVFFFPVVSMEKLIKCNVVYSTFRPKHRGVQRGWIHWQNLNRDTFVSNISDVPFHVWDPQIILSHTLKAHLEWALCSSYEDDAAGVFDYLCSERLVSSVGERYF